ncbi:MAG TPA: tetratricopeptide repeat-containing glycosyltransferase family protein, partial [Pirellulales bacterium]|nr:tetratricopeptide repeat-containing glycosyltransferase family protein [Pirellulales bacterium]
LNPRYSEASNNLAKAVFGLGRLREAEERFLDALREQPQNAELHANLGTVLQASGRHDEALACFDLSLMFDPKCVTAHYNRSMSLLSQGRWLEGWADYEYRWELGGQTRRQYRQPAWDGGPLDGRTILLWAEQGLGDMIQFVRYAKVLQEQGARVVLEAPPHVVSLFHSAPGIDQIVTEGDRVPAYDVQAPLLSLPGLLHTTPRNAPAEVPYLHAPAERIEHWRSVLGSEPRFRIGISWRGSPRHAHDHWRSVPLDYFAPLAAVPGVSLVSLQKGPGSEEIAALDGRFAVWQSNDDEPADSAEGLVNTAALMSCLDLVITVDTALAHLAGALARPVWTAVAALPDWRWLRRGSRTVWYPTMRLYRQRKLSRWRKVFARMTRDLRRHVARQR